MNTVPHNPDAHDERSFGTRLSDAELEAVLEHKPPVCPSFDFAARVASLAAAQPAPKPRRVLSYSRSAAALSAALLLFFMFVLVPWTQASFNSIAFDVELLAAGQLVAIAWWLSARRRA
jgi:hypothetical protein